MLASTLLKPDDTEIQLHKDGSWSTHSLRNEAQIIDTPTKIVEKVEVISDDIGKLNIDFLQSSNVSTKIFDCLVNLAIFSCRILFK